MSWTTDNSGTLATTVATEQTVDTPSTAGTYEFSFDLSNLALGEVIEWRVYKMIDGTNYRQVQKGTWMGGCIINPGQVSLPVETAGNDLKFTLKQLNGSSRNVPWLVERI